MACSKTGCVNSVSTISRSPLGVFVLSPKIVCPCLSKVVVLFMCNNPFSKSTSCFFKPKTSPIRNPQ